MTTFTFITIQLWTGKNKINERNEYVQETQHKQQTTTESTLFVVPEKKK